MKHKLYIMILIFLKVNLASAQSNQLDPIELEAFKVCQTENVFSQYHSDLKECVEKKMKNKDYSPYLKHETFNQLKYDVLGY